MFSFMGSAFGDFESHLIPLCQKDIVPTISRSNMALVFRSTAHPKLISGSDVG